jgi:glucosamine kinase
MLSEGTAGSANVRLGVEQSFASVHEATVQCMSGAGLSSRDFDQVVACLALAGATEPSQLEAARAREHPYRKAVFVTDAEAACIGAHGGRNGGVIVIGTGSIGWAELNGRQYRVGGWGWPISDEGSGAWLGCEALRRALWAYDGRIAWTPLLRSLFARFRSDPHAIVAWMTDALPKDFASFAPEIIEHACANDRVAVELLRLAGGHIDALARMLVAVGAGRLSLVGGLAASIEPRLADATRRHLVAPRGDALAGALQLAREAAESLCHDVAGPRHFR